MKTIDKLIPFWNELKIEQQQLIQSTLIIKEYKKDEIIHQLDQDCTGLSIVLSGSIRTFITSKNGKEITLYKLYDTEMCIFSASCALKDIHFDINISCLEKTILYIIPTNTLNKILNESKIFSDYIDKILKNRFSDTMWLLEQVVFDNMDTRLADYLLNEMIDNELHVTHEKIANDLGSAREVISRLLKHFEKEDIVTLRRNYIKINDEKKLLEISVK